MANKSSGKKRGRPSKKSAKKAEINRSWSIVMCAVGVLFLALCLIEGQNAWTMIRKSLFGIFGFTSYIVGPVLIYLAVLTATDKPVKWKMAQAGCFILLVSAFVQIFFAPEMVETSFFKSVGELYTQGSKNLFSGGLLSGIIASPLLLLFGELASKVTVTILGTVFLMFLTDTTPYDIYKRTSEQAVKQKQNLEKSMQESKAQRQEQRVQRESDRLCEEQAAAKSKKIDFAIDEPAVVQNGTGIALKEAFVETFDEVEKQKQLEKQKIEDIMKKLNLSPNDSDIDINIEDTTSVFPKRASTVAPIVAVEGLHPARGVAQAAADKAQTVDGEQLTMEENALALQEKSGAEELQEATYIYEYPPISLFEKGVNKHQGDVEKELKTNAQLLVSTLESFGVKTKIIDISRGPSVTRYELQPLAGVKISKITNLSDDIALNLAASGVRIEAPIPNKAAVGIEVPNKSSNAVSIRTILESDKFKDMSSPLSIALGIDIAGNVVVADLTKMPHLLIAGSTGSGKSVCVNAIITSFLYKSSPDDVKLILIDPKVVELAEYNGIPHLLMPVVTEPKKAAGALGSAVAEMEKRYKLFAQNSVRDIKGYNTLAGTTDELEKLPYVAIIIDELADLMMVCGKEVEDYICRIAQKARAAGMHLIVATQRPSVDVITGLIKANIPARIAFAVSSQIDSRTILDGGGAEKLLGMGDMLYLPLGASKPTRVQGTYVKDSEIAAVIKFVKQDYTADYNQDMIENMEQFAAASKGGLQSGDGAEQKDEMIQRAIEVVVDIGQASTSLLQRKLKLGYARAARIMDEMEEMGIVGPYDGSKPRQVLITKNQWLEMMINNE